MGWGPCTMQMHLLQVYYMWKFSHPTLFLTCPLKNPASYPRADVVCWISPTLTCNSRKRRHTSRLLCFPRGFSLAYNVISARCRMMPESVAQTTCGHFHANPGPSKPVSSSLRPVALSFCEVSGLTVQSGIGYVPCLPFLEGVGVEAVPAFGSQYIS